MIRRISYFMLIAIIAGMCLSQTLPSWAQGNFRNRNAGAAGTNAAQASPDGARQMGSATIQYDAETGSIIVITDEETNERIKSVIDGLDRPTPQVLIKVIFLEVTHSDSKDLGAEFAYNDQDNDGDSQQVATIFGLARETRGGFYKILDGDLEATLRAIAENNKLEVLSRPSVLARNNQEALITVGQEVPFITNSRVTSDGQTINTIQYSDIGIILQVTPRIMPDGMVELVVAPEISNLTAESVPVSETVSARVIAKRSADTTVVVKNGKTVVIGGMMENNMTEKVTKVPLLGDIPYLGALFRRTTKTKAKTELLIFLTPLIVENPNQMQDITSAERKNNRLVPNAFTDEEIDQFLNNHLPESSQPDLPENNQPENN